MALKTPSVYFAMPFHSILDGAAAFPSTDILDGVSRLLFNYPEGLWSSAKHGCKAISASTDLKRSGVVLLRSMWPREQPAERRL